MGDLGRRPPQQMLRMTQERSDSAPAFVPSSRGLQKRVWALARGLGRKQRGADWSVLTQHRPAATGPAGSDRPRPGSQQTGAVRRGSSSGSLGCWVSTPRRAGCRSPSPGAARKPEEQLVSAPALKHWERSLVLEKQHLAFSHRLLLPSRAPARERGSRWPLPPWRLRGGRCYPSCLHTRGPRGHWRRLVHGNIPGGPARPPVGSRVEEETAPCCESEECGSRWRGWLSGQGAALSVSMVPS